MPALFAVDEMTILLISLGFGLPVLVLVLVTSVRSRRGKERQDRLGAAFDRARSEGRNGTSGGS